MHNVKKFSSHIRVIDVVFSMKLFISTKFWRVKDYSTYVYICNMNNIQKVRKKKKYYQIYSSNSCFTVPPPPKRDDQCKYLTIICIKTNDFSIRCFHPGLVTIRFTDNLPLKISSWTYSSLPCITLGNKFQILSVFFSNGWNNSVDDQTMSFLREKFHLVDSFQLLNEQQFSQL